MNDQLINYFRYERIKIPYEYEIYGGYRNEPIEHEPIQVKKHEHESFFEYVKNNDLENIKSYIEKNGVNIVDVVRDKFSFTAFMMACYHKNYPLMDFLLEKGANINIYILFDHTPLSLAIDLRNMKLIHYLLIHGANISNVLYRSSSKERYLKKELDKFYTFLFTIRLPYLALLFSFEKDNVIECKHKHIVKYIFNDMIVREISSFIFD